MMSNNSMKDACESIIRSNVKVRYVGVLNRFGRTLTGRLREGVRPFFRQEEARNEFFITAIREGMRSSFTESLGRNHFTLTVHDKVKLVSFMHNDNIIYISIDATASYDEIVGIVNDAKRIFAGIC
jgi:hypothetical protein